MEIKLVIQIGKIPRLYTIDTSLSLKQNVHNICLMFDVPNESTYGLKLLESNDGTVVDHYISEDNIATLKDGFKLQLTQSLDIVIHRILNDISHESYEVRSNCYDELKVLSDDAEFVKRIVNEEHHLKVLKLMDNQNLAPDEMFACLKVLLNVLIRKCIIELSDSLVHKLIDIVKQRQMTKTLIGALAVLCQLLQMKSNKYDKNKREILQYLSVSEVIGCIPLNPNMTVNVDKNNLQLNAIHLVNMMAKTVKNEKHIEIVKQMNKNENKNIIYNAIICSDVDKDMAKALHGYQTYALREMQEKLITYISPAECSYEYDNVSLNRQSLVSIIDFEEAYFAMNSSAERNSDSFSAKSVRMSLVSFNSDESDETNLSSRSDGGHSKISVLTNDCICYLKKNYWKQFQQSNAEEQHYGVDFSSVAEKITRILASIFCIGERPKQTADFFYPIFFNRTFNVCFFQELFYRSIWLMSKTKREMKVTLKEDYSMLFKILSYQIKFILKERPHDYKILLAAMKKVTYWQVVDHIEKQSELEFLYFIKNDPNMLDIKERVTAANDDIIRTQRLKILQEGQTFPKLEQKKDVKIFIKLHSSKKMFVWGDWVNKKVVNPITFNISDIKFLVKGAACPPVRNNIVKKEFQQRVFTLVLNDDANLNFLANDSETANNWIDGINILLDNDERSENFVRDLKMLVEMDCHLQVIELQHIKIPSKAPTIPAKPITNPNFI